MIYYLSYNNKTNNDKRKGYFIMTIMSKRLLIAVMCGLLTMPMAMATANAKITVTIEDPKPGEGIQSASLGGTKATAISAKTKLIVKKGSKKNLNATVTPSAASQNVTYKSSNKKVVKVTSKGLVKGIKKGTAKITIQTTDGSGIKKTVKVTVK